MYLDSFRYDIIGELYFTPTLSNGEIDNNKKVFATYTQYAFNAFYMTMQDIEELENADGSLVPNGRNSIVAVSMWYLALESYINCLLKLTCFYKEISFEKEKTKTVNQRLSSLLKLLEIDDLKIKRTGLYERINEFSLFRNEVFHDRHIGNEVIFCKTSFSKTPFQCNQVDVIQGLMIFLELTSLLRYVIKGLDTMPDILLHYNSKAFYKKLDYLYDALVSPSLHWVLLKHKLKTDLSYLRREVTSIRSNVFLNPAAAFFVVDSPDIFKFNLNIQKTSILNNFLYQLINSEKIAPDKIRLGKYSISETRDLDKKSDIDNSVTINKK